ncbi:MAG: dolichol-phosphate mannosyltransferase [Crocosphaera sp.]|nr:dolichol-phosphate mannosyltransferase [Crocosphaera sp.]
MIKDKLSWFIIGAGVLFSLYLLTQVPEGVYFSGDGGLKALLAQQLGEGNIRIDLIPPDYEWVRQLWQDGLYPYEEPFVYYLNDRYYITFPYPFSLITAPFYSLLGERGLYIIPLVSTWLIWILFNIYLRFFDLNYWGKLLSIFLLVFTSNLTLYSGMYWEHTLAVLLCFIGMLILLKPKSSVTLTGAILSGVFVGLSAWIRSEFLAMIATLTFLVGLLTIVKICSEKNIFKLNDDSISFAKKINLSDLVILGDKGLIFIVSMYATVGTFFISNKLIYGHFLGIHALQIVEEFSLARRLTEAWESLLEIIVTFFEYFPVACFSLLYLLLFLVTKSFKEKLPRIILMGLIVISLITSIYWVNTHGLAEIKVFIKTWWFLILLSTVWLFLSRKETINIDQRMALTYIIGLLFTIGVALLVDSGSDEIAVGGKQWGQRYLLILLPFFTIIVVKQLSFFQKKSQPILKYFTIFLFSIFIIIGFHKNMYQGTLFFQKTHRGVSEAIELLKNHPSPIVVVSHQYAAQLLEPSLTEDKIFFLVDEMEDFSKLNQELLVNNQDNFVYVCYPYRKCEIPKIISQNGNIVENNNKYFSIELENLGKIGRYPMYNAKLISNNN